MKYINQLDYENLAYITRTSLKGEEYEKGQSSTIRSSGCGLCSAVMVADRLIPECDFTLEDALQLSYDTGANHHVGTDYTIFAPAFAQKVGLKHEPTSDPERLIYCLRTGGAAVAHVGGDHQEHVGIFSHKGHYIAVIDVEPDGRVAILDPSYKQNKYEEDGRKGKVQIKNGVIALCSIEDLAQDCENRTPSFHLFWRA